MCDVWASRLLIGQGCHDGRDQALHSDAAYFAMCGRESISWLTNARDVRASRAVSACLDIAALLTLLPVWLNLAIHGSQPACRGPS